MKKFLPALAILSLALIGAGCNNNPMPNDQSNTSAAQTPDTSKSYSMADVQSANTPEKCWTAINGKIYDLTDWINKHPGGPDNIVKLCGTDGSTAFNNQHGGQGRPEKVLEGYQIGTLN